MPFPETEVDRLKRKTILKTDLIGMTPAQYILYRINHSSNQAIDAENLEINIEEIDMVPALPGEDCSVVAVVKIKPGENTNWKGELEYRIPQLEISRYYGDFIELALADIKDLADYNALAVKYKMPPKVFQHTELLGLEGSTISYRLDFNNPFFKGALRVVITGITNLLTDKPVVDRLLQFTGTPA